MKENNGKEPTAEQLEACRRRADEAMAQMEDAGIAQIADTVIYVDEIGKLIETTIDKRAKACQAALDALDKAMKEEKLSDAEARGGGWGTGAVLRDRLAVRAPRGG